MLLKLSNRLLDIKMFCLSPYRMEENILSIPKIKVGLPSVWVLVMVSAPQSSQKIKKSDQPMAERKAMYFLVFHPLCINFVIIVYVRNG